MTTLSQAETAGLGGTVGGHAPGETGVVDELLRRMCTQYDVDPDELRRHAIEILREFTDVRIYAFLPVLVEKRLREQLRLWRRTA